MSQELLQAHRRLASRYPARQGALQAAQNRVASWDAGSLVHRNGACWQEIPWLPRWEARLLWPRGQVAMSASEDKLFLVFTDLDGSLLDHHSYSYRDALPQLHRLEHLGIPVIPATSKTRAEIEQLRAELGNGHPFIVENGAAVYIPVGYFNAQPEGTIEREAYWVREMAAPRAKWLDLLAQLGDEFPEEFDYFFRAGTQGIVRMTGLPEAQAAQANQREYSEPVKWLGDDAGKTGFIARLHAGGASVLQGGRFLAVCRRLR